MENKLDAKKLFDEYYHGEATQLSDFLVDSLVESIQKYTEKHKVQTELNDFFRSISYALHTVVNSHTEGDAKEVFTQEKRIALTKFADATVKKFVEEFPEMEMKCYYAMPLIIMDAVAFSIFSSNKQLEHNAKLKAEEIIKEADKNE